MRRLGERGGFSHPGLRSVRTYGSCFQQVAWTERLSESEAEMRRVRLFQCLHSGF